MSNNGNYSKAAPRTKTILDSPRFKITGERQQNAKGAPTFHLFYNVSPDAPWNAAPRIHMYSNVEGDKDNGRIEAKISMKEALSFLEAVRLASDLTQEFKRFSLQTKEHVWSGREKSKEPLLKTTLVVDRDDKGVYVALLHFDKSRPRIKFHFGYSMYHMLVNQDGSPADGPELSRYAALAYYEEVKPLLIKVSEKYYAPRPPKDDNGGGNNGGYNSNRGNGGGNYGNNNNDDSTTYSDDLDL